MSEPTNDDCDFSPGHARDRSRAVVPELFWGDDLETALSQTPNSPESAFPLFVYSDPVEKARPLTKGKSKTLGGLMSPTRWKLESSNIPVFQDSNEFDMLRKGSSLERGERVRMLNYGAEGVVDEFLDDNTVLISFEDESPLALTLNQIERVDVPIETPPEDIPQIIPPIELPDDRGPVSMHGSLRHETTPRQSTAPFVEPKKVKAILRRTQTAPQSLSKDRKRRKHRRPRGKYIPSPPSRPKPARLRSQPSNSATKSQDHAPPLKQPERKEPHSDDQPEPDSLPQGANAPSLQSARGGSTPKVRLVSKNNASLRRSHSEILDPQPPDNFASHSRTQSSKLSKSITTPNFNKNSPKDSDAKSDDFVRTSKEKPGSLQRSATAIRKLQSGSEDLIIPDDREDKLASILTQGANFLLYPIRGPPQFVLVRCSTDLTQVLWNDLPQSVPSSELKMILFGRRGPGFTRHDQKLHDEVRQLRPDSKSTPSTPRIQTLDTLPSAENRSFSIVFQSTTLDLEASTEKQRDLWVLAVRWLKTVMQKAASGVPYNFKHVTHVDSAFKWTSQNLDQILAMTRKLGADKFQHIVPVKGGYEMQPLNSPQHERKPVEEWNEELVLDWLRSIRFEAYCTNFADGRVDGPLLVELTVQEMAEDLFITNKLHRKRILNEINKLKQKQ